MDFKDIHSQIPLFLCTDCVAIWHRDYRRGFKPCPVCGQVYNFHNHIDQSGMYFLKLFDCNYEEHIFYEQFGVLAKTYCSAHEIGEFMSLRFIVNALKNSRRFVHILTFGIDPFFIGLLSSVATTFSFPPRHEPGTFVKVIAVVDTKSDYVQKNIIQPCKDIDPLAVGLDIQFIDKQDWDEQTHVKLIVIDGILMVKGSTNLTLAGWRKAQEHRDIVEISMDLEMIRDYHNRYFAPMWLEVAPGLSY